MEFRKLLSSKSNFIFKYNFRYNIKGIYNFNWEWDWFCIVEWCWL